LPGCIRIFLGLNRMQTFDLAIIGGGIVGLATAYRALERFPGLRLLLLEKEAQLAYHQTGHNSGVLHSGIYYRPGSLKAANCRDGKRAMEQFCAQQEISFDLCGKVIVATSAAELPRLQTLFERGVANGVHCRKIDRAELLELEPHCAGIEAIHVPEAGIVDYRRVSARLGELIQNKGGTIQCSSHVSDFHSNAGNVVLISTGGDFEVKFVVNCAGLQSDRVAGKSGAEPPAQIVPFRGEYFKLMPSAEQLCRNLIYPVPDPSFPFLGVHFTRMIEGGVECGPNAVLALAREGYRKTDINLTDIWELLRYRGFWKLAARHWKTGLGEMWRSISKRAFVAALQRLVPEIRGSDLEAAPAGVRAQAISPDGAMVDDFLLVESPNMIHVCNAPSPAATASLNIGRLIVEKLAGHIGL
jgi:L-2-hydroxyglutarate oxidase